MIETYYNVYVYGELISDTFGHLTKEEAMELVDEYEREGYDCVQVKEVEVDSETPEETNAWLRAGGY